MQTINVNELIAAGIGFNIQKDDRQFDECGEIKGLLEITDETYEARDSSGDARVLVNPEELCDSYNICVENGRIKEHQVELEIDGEILDAWVEYEWIAPSYMSGRWAHIKDAHFAEQLETYLTTQKDDRLWQDNGAKDPVWGEIRYYVDERNARYRRLKRYCRKLRQSKNHDKRRRVKSAIWRRYKQSCSIAARRKEWYLLMLTKAQVSELMDILQ